MAEENVRLVDWEETKRAVADAEDSLWVPRSKGWLVLTYALCSTATVVLSQWAVRLVPLPMTLAALQCAAVAVMLLLLRVCISMPAESSTALEVLQFLAAPALLAGCLVTSAHLTATSGEHTRALVGALAPLAVCALDSVSGFSLPSVRGVVGLVALLLGLGCLHIEVRSTSVPAIAVCAILLVSAEAVVVKHVIERVHMSVWTRTLLTNLVAPLLIAPLVFATAEYARGRGRRLPSGPQAARARVTLPPATREADRCAHRDRSLRLWRSARRRGASVHNLLVDGRPLSPRALLVTGLASVSALGSSLSGFKLRDTVSATSFALVSGATLFAAVLVSQAIWVTPVSRMSRPCFGLIGLSLLLAFAYKPSVKRSARPPDPHEAVDRAVEEAERMIAEADRLVAQAERAAVGRR
jgi:hypothetical protein